MPYTVPHTVPAQFPHRRPMIIGHGSILHHPNGGGHPIKTICTTQPPLSGYDIGWAPDHRDKPIQLPIPARRPSRPGGDGEASRLLPAPLSSGPLSGPSSSGSSSSSVIASTTASLHNVDSAQTCAFIDDGGTACFTASRLPLPPSPIPTLSFGYHSARPICSSRKARKISHNMPGRPPNNKRPTDGGSESDESAGGHAGAKMKLPRLDRGGPDDFSLVVKNRLQQYTRTGQACDRCKVRKIRCDALPEGCSHCINLNLECNVTDRVTGRTERRGYLQELEREKNAMMEHIRGLEKLLQDNSVEVKAYVNAGWAQYPPGVTLDDMGNPVRTAAVSNDWAQVGSIWVKNPQAPVYTPSYPRSQLQSRPEERHLGVGQDRSPLSSIRGTQLSILGTTIDIASFDAPDIDEPPPDTQISTPLYNKSVQAFLQSSMGVNPPMQVDLPSRDDAFNYAEWYFLTISTFVPLLHKPSFMQSLTRIYDEPNFKPSVAELVTVHMVYATIYFHCGVRNWQEADRRNNLNDLSNKHYHFALSKIYDLYSSPELAAVQALALIASHTRAFPKPGCGTIVANMALQRALELNLHRRSRLPGEGTNLDNELRKRTWWVILTVVIAVRGRRGFPMPITVEEFDVDFPEPIADELLTESGVDTSRDIPCPYHAGLAGFKIAPLFMEMYSNIYSVRRDVDNYSNIVNALERQLQAWEDALPACLRLDMTAQLDHHHIAALYTKTFALELRLCLRHPSVATTTDKKMMADNTRICEETSREFMRCVEQILQMKSLDTTWYQMSIYAGCIFSMLVATWERRYETTPEQVVQLRREMDIWMTVLRETSLLLGSGPGITTQLRRIMDRTIEWIERDMRINNPRTSLLGIPEARQTPEPQPATYQPAQPAQPAQPTQTTQRSTAVPNGTAHADNVTKSYYQDPNLNNAQAPYPNLAYGDESHNNAAQQPPGYQPDNAMFYNTNPEAAVAAEAAAAAAASDGSAQANPLAAFASQAGRHVPTQAPADMMWHARGSTWQDWTTAMADSQDRYSANALLTLGNGARNSFTTSLLTNGTDGQGGTTEMGVPQAAQWPLLMFDHASTSGS